MVGRGWQDDGGKGNLHLGSSLGRAAKCTNLLALARVGLLKEKFESFHKGFLREDWEGGFET